MKTKERAERKGVFSFKMRLGNAIGFFLLLLLVDFLRGREVFSIDNLVDKTLMGLFMFLIYPLMARAFLQVPRKEEEDAK